VIGQLERLIDAELWRSLLLFEATGECMARHYSFPGWSKKFSVDASVMKNSRY